MVAMVIIIIAYVTLI